MTDAAPVRTAVIGAGTISRAVHLPLLARLPAFDLRALSDLDPSAAAELGRRYGARAATTAQLLVADDVDAVVVATPGNHARIAREALLAGKHVFAEKPFALTAAEAEEVGALAASLGLVLQVGTMKTHDALVPPARAAVAAMDDVRLVRVEVRHPADAPQVQHLRTPPPTARAALPAPAREAVADAAAYDDARVREAIGEVPPAWAHVYRTQLCGSLVHQTSLLRALGLSLPAGFTHAEAFPAPGGPPGTSPGTSPGSSPAGPPSLLATAALSPSTRLVLTWSWLPRYPAYTETLTVLAADGGLVLDLAPPYVLDARSVLEVTRAGPDLGSGTGEVVRTVAGADGAFQRQLEAFAASVRTGAPVLCDAAGAAADARCAQALLRALVASTGVVLGGEAAAHAAVRGGREGDGVVTG